MRFLLLSAVAVLKTLLCKGISLVLLTGWFVRENRAHSAASGTVPARVMLRNMQRALCWRRCCHLLAVEKGRGKPEADAPAAPGRTGPPHCIDEGSEITKNGKPGLASRFLLLMIDEGQCAERLSGRIPQP